MELLDGAHPDDPALDMALTAVLLDAVATGQAREVVRVFRPGPAVAFGRLDRLQSGFPQACDIAAGHGRTPVLRLSGGHAAAYDTDCVLVEIIRRDRGVIGGLEERFVDLVGLVADALGGLGLALELGEREGEYCPGRFSLHLPGAGKVVGAAQRVVQGAALASAVIVVSGAERLRAVIGAVYAALGFAVDVRMAGALTEAHSDLDAETVRDAVARQALVRYGAQSATVGRDVRRRAAARRSSFEPRSVLNPGKSGSVEPAAPSP